MIRGPKSGDGARSPVYYRGLPGLAAPLSRPGPPGDEMYPLATGMLSDGTLAAEPGFSGSWWGAGGRWLLWPLRVVLWTALLVIMFRGITAIMVNHAAAPAGGGPGAGARPFPVSLAEAYATEFGRVYLGFSPQSQAPREQALAAFVPAGLLAANPNLGWNGAGQLNLQSLQVAGIKVEDPQHAVVTLLALVNGQLMELGVPVAATGQGNGMVVSAEPAWLPAPPQIAPPGRPAWNRPGGPKPADE